MPERLLSTRGLYALRDLMEEAETGVQDPERDEERAAQWQRVSENLNGTSGPFHDETRPMEQLHNALYYVLQPLNFLVERMEREARENMYLVLELLTTPGEMDEDYAGLVVDRVNSWLDTYGRDRLKEGVGTDGKPR